MCMSYLLCMPCIQDHLVLLLWSDCGTGLHCSREDSLIVATLLATVVGCNTVRLLLSIHKQTDHLSCVS
jgi:undecaprenyl pyrophosphate phosphatase UppP